MLSQAAVTTSDSAAAASGQSAANLSQFSSPSGKPGGKVIANPVN